MKLKNLKISKRLCALLLTGTIAVSTTGCSFTKNLIPNKMYGGNTVEFYDDITNGENKTIPENYIENVFGYDEAWDLVVYQDTLGFVYHNEIENIEHTPNVSINVISGSATTTARLNFRLGPTTDYKSLQVLPKGAITEVLGVTNNNWYIVKYEGKIGYICGTYVNYKPENKNLTGNGTYGYTTTGVNFRIGPGKEFSRITTLSKGTKVEYVDYLDNGWYCVKYHDTIGYLYGKYLNYNTEQIYEEEKAIPIAEYRSDFSKIVYANKETALLDSASPTSDSSYNISKYEACEVLNEIGAWYQVRCNGLDGFVNKFDTTELQETVVVVDISRQLLTLYKNGIIILETPVVTGKKESHDTPTGLYDIKYKKKDTYLRGADYRCHVDYWMPFYNGYGLHDADWRKNFGGTIYETNGSHGCVNIPPELTDDIYNNVSSGTKVLVHK